METKNKNIEHRTFSYELRAGDGDNERSVSGYAAVFGKRSENLGGFTEIIQEGAFDGALKSSDVRALVNHDPTLLLARSSSGTLDLSIDATGLMYRFDAPETQAGNDLLTLVKRGDLKESSFGFTIDEDKWEENEETGAWTRTILKVKRLYDVSPVTFPAYPDTSVAQRSLQKVKDEKHPEPEYRKELLEAINESDKLL